MHNHVKEHRAPRSIICIFLPQDFTADVSTVLKAVVLSIQNVKKTVFL